MTMPPAPFDAPDAQPFVLDGGATGVLLLHGFTSTPQSVCHLGHALHAGSGATISVPRLAGHGTTPEDLARTGQLDWLVSVETALDVLGARCDRVVMAGLSLGGTLALNVAARLPDRVQGVVTINGSTGIYPPQVVQPLYRKDTTAFVDGIGSDIRHPGRAELCYDRIPTATLRERFLLTHATGALLPLIRQPILVIQSRIDHVVDPSNALRIVGGVGSDDIALCWLADSYHVATLDHDRDRIADRMIRFLRDHANG